MARFSRIGTLCLFLAACQREGADSPEQAAALWTHWMVCEHRQAIQQAELTLLEREATIAAQRAAIAPASSPPPSLIDFIQQHRDELDLCRITIRDIRPLDDAHKFAVSLQVTYSQIDPHSLHLLNHSPRFDIEVSSIEGRWFVTREPLLIPGESSYHLRGLE